jgi:hypothetical protein
LSLFRVLEKSLGASLHSKISSPNHYSIKYMKPKRLT